MIKRKNKDSIVPTSYSRDGEDSTPDTDLFLVLFDPRGVLGEVHVMSMFLLLGVLSIMVLMVLSLFNQPDRVHLVAKFDLIKSHDGNVVLERICG